MRRVELEENVSPIRKFAGGTGAESPLGAVGR
jgi:hypothetical protein